jgi:intein/homing endonuclease
VISTTGEHPFWVADKGWVEAKDLVVGSLLQTEDGRIVDVDKVEKREGQFPVDNFKVEGIPTYFVSDLGILVHNSYYDLSNPNRIDPTTLDLNELVNAANEPLGKGGLTKAGRALDKHATGQRGVSPFPHLTGNNANKNLIAQQQVDEILYHPDVVFVGIGNKGAVEARIPDGRGIRFNCDGSFSGFLD